MINKICLFTLIILSSCNFKNEINDDDKILDTIVSKIDTSKYQIIFEISKSNEYVVSKIKELKKIYLSQNKFKLDSLKQVWGIKDDKVFNSNEYDFLISQKNNSEWDSIKLNLLEKKINKNQKSKLIKKVFVSKPIYSKNKNFSLIYFKEDWSGIIVLKNVDGKWMDYNIIIPMLIQPTANIM